VADVRRVVTVHAGTSDPMRNEILGHIEQALLAAGASRIWIDPATRPDLAVMVDMAVVPEVVEIAGLRELPVTLRD
jgi:hypothetical protein